MKVFACCHLQRIGNSKAGGRWKYKHTLLILSCIPWFVEYAGVSFSLHRHIPSYCPGGSDNGLMDKSDRVLVFHLYPKLSLLARLP